MTHSEAPKGQHIVSRDLLMAEVDEGSSRPSASVHDRELKISFNQFQSIHKLWCNDKEVVPEIYAKAPNNISMEHGQWRCYRRNYISVECSYSLTDAVNQQPIFLEVDAALLEVQALAMTVCAAVDGAGGKSIELVHYTTKRDKGDQYAVPLVRLSPSTPSGGGKSPLLPLQFEPDLSAAADPASGRHVFQRLQFLKSTANNGRYRTPQQHYYLAPTLCADVRRPGEYWPRWERVAQQLSEPLVVRGRSPAHYNNNDSRGSRASRRDGGVGKVRKAKDRSAIATYNGRRSSSGMRSTSTDTTEGSSPYSWNPFEGHGPNCSCVTDGHALTQGEYHANGVPYEP